MGYTHGRLTCIGCQSFQSYSMGFNSLTNREQQQTELIHDPFVRWKCYRLTLTRLNVITVRVKN